LQLLQRCSQQEAEAKTVQEQCDVLQAEMVKLARTQQDLSKEIAQTEELNHNAFNEISMVFKLEYKRLTFNAAIDPLIHSPEEVAATLSNELRDLESTLLKLEVRG
jgi:hypothetical protein